MCQKFVYAGAAVTFGPKGLTGHGGRLVFSP